MSTDSCQELKKVVTNNTGSWKSGKQSTAEKAVKKLGEKGCIEELREISNKYSGSSNSHKQEIAEMAVDYI